MRYRTSTPSSTRPLHLVTVLERVLTTVLTSAVAVHLCGTAVAAPSAMVDSNVLVVDDDGGVGVNFLDLPAAVAAATDGETLLVKPGTYSAFVLFDKGIDIVADTSGGTGTVTCNGGPSIRQLSAGKRATLRGLKIVNANEAGLQIKSCAGDVWIEDCKMTGAQGDGTFTDPDPHPNGYAGAEIATSARVVFNRCTITGGLGADYLPLVGIHGNGGPGVYVRASSVALYQCAIKGGNGGSVADDDAPWSGGDGGIGLQVFSGETMCSGCTIAGGIGGMGGEDFDIFVGWSCGDGGSGGAAIGQAYGDPGPGDVQLRDCTLTPGAGGAPYPGASCSFGQAGPIFDVMSVSVATFAGDAFSHLAVSPMRDGGTAFFAMKGTPGSYAVLGISTAPTLFLDPFLGGTILIDVASTALLYPGFLPFSGAKQVIVSVNLGIAASQGLSLFTQPIFVVPPTFELVVGAGSVLTVLDPNL
ncbi:hypothetical protein Pla163_05070 [Planctomycetes bacterium Pla163]|uniref:Right handed beta helix domain-containing protein n=1 Tax=Rohdeia mirabilis TaxID=2528008 RepID=A0A518CW34_9BACT|nr:hypothetical protein Pla163_05070 [Planctomycetes bacterium Pla163]